MTTAQRATALRVCAALYGLGLAISMVWYWIRPAPPGQLPGFMTSLAYDANASLRFIVSLIVLPIVSTMLWKPLLDRLAQEDVQRWARNAAAISLLSALWISLLTKLVYWAAIPGAIGVIAAYALRHVNAGFTRRDIILLFAIAPLWMALLDLTKLEYDQALVVATLLVFSIRVALVFLRPTWGLDPALCFSLAPLALISQTHVFARDQRHFGWPPLLIALLTPFAMRLLVKNTPSARLVLRRALAWFIYPVACYAYMSAGSLLSAESVPRSNLFEDMQHVVPAAEMMRGERAYRDIVPAHGFIQDALLDYALMRHGDRTVGQLLRGRKAISMLSAIAFYVIGVAATCAMEFGVLTFFFAESIGLSDLDFRYVPPLIALALILFAVQMRRPQLLAYAAAAVVFAFMTSIDFGVYMGIVLLFAVTCFRGVRLRALTYAAVGGGIAAVVVAMALGVNGILSDFLRVTFREIPALGPAYALGVFETPAAMGQARSLPEALYAFLEGSSYIYMIWGAAMIFFAVAVTVHSTGSTRRRTRLDTLLVIASAMVVFVLSYGERHHLYVRMFVPAFLTVSVFTMFRARLPRLRLAAPLLAALVLIDAHPTYHLAITAALRHARRPLDGTVQEIGDIPHARGALFRSEEKAMIEAAARYFRSNLAPGETFFDFTNRGLLYFLFDRDCPVRHIEVAFYEDERLQREVIDRLEHNPHVRLAIIPREEDSGVDGVANRIRAPLVWQYLQQRFTPAGAEGELIFWRRK